MGGISFRKTNLFTDCGKYNCSKRTIQRKIDSYQVLALEKVPREVIILMDTTYWGRNFGVMLFKDAITKENLLKHYVDSETNSLYRKGIKEMEEQKKVKVSIPTKG